MELLYARRHNLKSPNEILTLWKARWWHTESTCYVLKYDLYHLIIALWIINSLIWPVTCVMLILNYHILNFLFLLLQIVILNGTNGDELWYTVSMGSDLSPLVPSPLSLKADGEKDAFAFWLQSHKEELETTTKVWRVFYVSTKDFTWNNKFMYWRTHGTYWYTYWYSVVGVIKPCISKTLKCSGEPENMAALTTGGDFV